MFWMPDQVGMTNLGLFARLSILEMAETRGIARALRFAGYGVEHCSAEEISHLENGNGAQPPAKEKNHYPEPPSGKIEIGF
jgi:hypothetical protein